MKTTRPVAVADHRNRRGGWLIVLGNDPSSQSGRNSESFEIISRHILKFNSVALAAHNQVPVLEPFRERKQIGQSLIRRSQDSEFGDRRQHSEAFTWRRLLGTKMESDEFFRIPDGKLRVGAESDSQDAGIDPDSHAKR